MESPTLDALESFIAVAAEGHFTRAAERMHLAQPALTKRIQQLERQLGARLFQRDRRGVRLTPEGAVLLPRARRVLEARGQLLETARQVTSGELGEVRVGFTPSALSSVLPAIVQAFRRRHPRISCALVEASTADQLDALARGALDVGILRPPVDHSGDLVWETFMREPFVAAVPRTHAAARRRTVPLRELANEPFVLVARDAAPTVHDQVIAACAAAGFTPRVVQEGRHVHAVAGLVSAGCGVSILPASAEHLRFPGVVYRPLERTSLSIVLAVAYRRDLASSAAHTFITEAKRIGRAMDEGARHESR